MKVSRDDLREFAGHFVESLPKRRSEKAHVIGLSGELGAGKTAFVQEVAKVLGVQRSVTSPTFVVAQAYPITHPVFERLVHIDAYRLEKMDRDTVGWNSYLENPANLILIEWPDRIPGGVPKEARGLQFTVVGDTVRDIEEKT